MTAALSDGKVYRGLSVESQAEVDEFFIRNACILISLMSLIKVTFWIFEINSVSMQFSKDMMCAMADGVHLVGSVGRVVKHHFSQLCLHPC